MQLPKPATRGAKPPATDLGAARSPLQGASCRGRCRSDRGRGEADSS